MRMNMKTDSIYEFLWWTCAVMVLACAVGFGYDLGRLHTFLDGVKSGVAAHNENASYSFKPLSLLQSELCKSPTEAYLGSKQLHRQFGGMYDNNFWYLD